jgi:hypothetical protein
MLQALAKSYYSDSTSFIYLRLLFVFCVFRIVYFSLCGPGYLAPRGMEWYLHSVKGLVSSLVLRLNLSGLSKLTSAAARLEERLAPRLLGWVHRHRE